jgi:hypothetical protein
MRRETIGLAGLLDRRIAGWPDVRAGAVSFWASLVDGRWGLELLAKARTLHTGTTRSTR